MKGFRTINKMGEKNADIRFVKNLLITLLYIIIIPIIIYDIFLIVQTIINPDKTPDVFGIKTFSIVSGSMEPTINIDDIVIVKKADINDINLNDIITFKIDNETITHRVQNIGYVDNILIYTTKGDSNEVTDIETVKYEQIEGKYIGKIPKVGKILSLLKNKTVFGFILLMLLTCYLLQKKSISKKIERKEKREKFERKMGLQ